MTMTKESYVLVLCGTPLPFYQELEILLVNHLNICFISHSERLEAIDQINIDASDAEDNELTHFIFLGLEKAVALEKLRLNSSRDGYIQETLLKTTTFIPFPHQWLKAMDDGLVNWNTVELESDHLTPIEELLNAFGHETRDQLEKVTGAFKPLLDYVHYKNHVSKESKDLATLWAENDAVELRALDDLTFALLPVSDQPHCLHALLVLRRRKQNEHYRYQNDAPLPVFAFFYQGQSRPIIESIEEIESLALDRFVFYGDKDSFDQVSSVFNAEENILISHAEQEGYLSRIMYDCSDNVLDPSFNQTISEACLALMGTNRVVEHYRCTLYLPLYMGKRPYNNQLVAGIDAVEYDETSEQGQALQHFYPSIRHYIFDTGDNTSHDAVQPIREWKLRGMKDIDQFTYQWCVTQPDLDTMIEADVTDVRLYQYFNQVCLLAISVQSTGSMASHSTLKFDDLCWWYGLAFSSEERWQFLKTQQMRNWLSFTRSARVLFPRFSQGQEKQAVLSENYLIKSCIIHEETRTKTEIDGINTTERCEKNNFSNLMSYFLHCFFTVDDVNQYFDKNDHQVLEELLFVNITYAYYGSELDQKSADNLLRQALSMETEPDGLDHSDYQQLQTNQMLSGYSKDSNVYLGCGRFFNDVMAKQMIPLVYERTLLLSLFYQASLRFYNRKIVSLTEHIKIKSTTSDYKKTQYKMSALQKSLTYFSNIFWIDDVTPQSQIKAIFKLQQQVLELTHHDKLIKGKMKRVNELLQGQHQLLMYKKSTKANFFLVLLMAIITLIIGADLLDSGVFSEWSAKFLKLVGR